MAAPHYAAIVHRFKAPAIKHEVLAPVKRPRQCAPAALPRPHTLPLATDVFQIGMHAPTQLKNPAAPGPAPLALTLTP